MTVELGRCLTMEINGRLVIPVQQEYQNSVWIVRERHLVVRRVMLSLSEIEGATNELPISKSRVT